MPRSRRRASRTRSGRPPGWRCPARGATSTSTARSSASARRPGLTSSSRLPIDGSRPCRRLMPSFDVVCRVDLQEVDNAVNQALREVGQRFDFKNSKTELRREDKALQLHSSDDFKVRALADILREKLAKRQVPLKAVSFGDVEPGPA